MSFKITTISPNLVKYEFEDEYHHITSIITLNEKIIEMNNNIILWKVAYKVYSDLVYYQRLNDDSKEKLIQLFNNTTIDPITLHYTTNVAIPRGWGINRPDVKDLIVSNLGDLAKHLRKHDHAGSYIQFEFLENQLNYYFLWK